MKRYGRLEGKVAIITGAASGIGRATSFLCAKEGAKILLADINESGLRDVADQLKNNGGVAMVQKTNVADEEQVKKLIATALEKYSQVDILCNNAGISGKISDLEEQDGEEWREVFNVNVLGTVYGTKHVCKHMRERNYGSIVNTASAAGIRAGAGGNAYSASKAAIINFTQTAACDLGNSNVRVNAVCPGLIETEMTREIFCYAREHGKEAKLGYRCELRRYGTVEEVARTILFLASDDSSYITGQAIPVDGGNTASLNMPGMKI